LAVLLLQKEAGIQHPLRVVPLFETLKDLDGAATTMNTLFNMHKGIRQSMAWLHSWTGLIFGWLIFAIFLMGSLSYYRHEINL
ncbi:phosphoenolpyruvate carboxylase, partial [Acinetobacter oleivorans]|uniref:phosphoenolpyruvate carboxylase n=1 Tax=Acinetobacter oleivorans TaxID=1148157 RepID=UPI001D183585